jgi:predicted RNA binding protein YcfA (HicA-like mRNA interferase family)
VDSRALIRGLERAGWRLVRVRGSHHQYRHPERAGVFTIPHPRPDLPIGTLRAILKQAGLAEGDLR